ncbi:MAG: multicopper oxidase family protein, partial [Methyloligellaceae bacterium]
KRGAEVWVRLKNQLPQPTTIHWHGIRIVNAMDGVAGLTQDPVPPGETFDYRFRVPDAGTYWYHPHNRSWEQLARGLYGALVVEEDSPPDVDRDLLVIADDWRLDAAGKIDEKTLGSLFERAHAGRLGNELTLNGLALAELPVRSGERIRLRLFNSCNARVLKLHFEDLAPQVIAYDGQPATPAPLPDGKIEIAPAQRADLLIDMTGAPGSKAAITEISNDRLVAGRFVYESEARLQRDYAPLHLPANDLLAPDLANATKVDLVMTGGAMGGLERATYKGKDFGLRELARQHGQVWAMNGVAGMTKKPLFSAKRGQTVAIRMVNETRWPHAMHLHGHHFREAQTSAASGTAPWRDTILLKADKTRTVAFVADNPGKWMLHCHMLEHQAGGMATWFEVTG